MQPGDINTLKEALGDKGITYQPIQDTICVIFSGNEADEKQFEILKDTATALGYDLDEDESWTPGMGFFMYKYYYILKPVPAPF